MTKLDLLGLTLVALFGVLYYLSVKATKNPNNPFNLGESFIDENGKTSMGRVCIFGAFVVSSWAIVAMVVTDQLTEWMVTAYLGSFVLNGVGSQFAKGKTANDSRPN